MSELRFHPFLGTWVITATHRQDRTFLPPAEGCPLCPTWPGGPATEMPEPSYEIAVFDNKFPSLSQDPSEPSVSGAAWMPVEPSYGVCEVVCYSDDHDATFATLPIERARQLVRVWKHRWQALAADDRLEYGFIFENKGREIGVTLTHPHGQIYGYPFLPPNVLQRLEEERAHLAKNGTTLWDDWLGFELNVGSRIVRETAEFVTVAPFFARFPYEAWIVPKSPIRNLAEMEPFEMDSFGEAIHDLANRYDRLFGFSLPYVMAMHQEPLKRQHPYTRVSVEFMPLHRTSDKLKYLAGSETGAGTFVTDLLPEVAAARLRAAI